MKRFLALLLVVVATPLVAALPALPASGADAPTITLVAHDSFAVSKSVLRDFTRQTGIKVKVLRSGGDAGTALNQVILTKDHPIGDAFFGVDNTLLSRAIDNDVFEVYRPAALDQVASEWQLDTTNHLTPIDHGDVCINFDKKWFAKHKVAVPQTLADLTKPQYKDLLVVEDAAASSPGLAFMLGTIDRYGESGWRDYWSKLRANGVKVVSDWTTAYDGNFTQGGGKGARPLVVSYASDPAAAVYFAKPEPSTSPVGTMLDSCFRQVEFAGVLKGTAHQAEARKLVDFMLSEEFQADIPLQMFVFPVRDATPLPPEFVKFADVATDPLTLPPADIAQHRDEWIDQWTQTVLR